MPVYQGRETGTGIFFNTIFNYLGVWRKENQAMHDDGTFQDRMHKITHGVFLFLFVATKYQWWTNQRAIELDASSQGLLLSVPGCTRLCTQLHYQSTGRPPPGCVPSCTVSLQDDHLQLCTQLTTSSCVPSCTVSLQDDHLQLCAQLHCQSTGRPPPAVCPVALSVYRMTTSRRCAQLHCQSTG